MDITVDTLLKAGLEPDDLVDASIGDNPTDTWPMGLKRPRTTHGAVPVVLAKSAATVSLLLRGTGSDLQFFRYPRQDSNLRPAE